MKRTENAISYVIYSEDRARILAVKRPPDDELPDAWGLPAGTVKEGETPEDAVLRSGKEKLGVKLEINGMLNEGKIERETYVLHMKLYEVKITEGEPKIPQASEGVTQYVEWKWKKPEELKEAASKGSLCSRLFLDKLGIGW
ncbi:MAG: NUDIX domain-containing protein [Candidatus Aenigmarchaeota archaeon]